MKRPIRFRHRKDVQATYDRMTGNLIIGKDDVRPISPLLIDISVTTKCEGGCSFCYQDARPDGQDADLESTLQAIRNLPAKPFQVALGGGEPANWKYLNQFVDGLGEMGIDVTMTVGPGLSRDGSFMLHLVTQRTAMKAVGVSFIPGRDERDFLAAVDCCGGMAYAHLVLRRETLPDLAKRFKDRWWPDGLAGVVLLLPKPVGRGKGLVPPTMHEIRTFVDDYVRPWAKWYEGTRTVAVDPCLGVALPGLPAFLLAGCDGGQYSMYWNAVTGTVSRCSFLPKGTGEEVPWDGTRRDFNRIWKAWGGPVQGCPFKPTH